MFQHGPSMGSKPNVGSPSLASSLGKRQNEKTGTKTSPLIPDHQDHNHNHHHHLHHHHHHQHHRHHFHRLRRHDVHRHRYPQHRNPNHEFVVKVNSDDHCVWQQFAIRAKRLANSSLKCLKLLSIFQQNILAAMSFHRAPLLSRRSYYLRVRNRASYWKLHLEEQTKTKEWRENLSTSKTSTSFAT